VIIVCYGICLVDILVIWWYFRRQNAKKVEIQAHPDYVKLLNQEYVRFPLSPTFSIDSFLFPFLHCGSIEESHYRLATVMLAQ